MSKTQSTSLYELSLANLPLTLFTPDQMQTSPFHL